MDSLNFEFILFIYNMQPVIKFFSNNNKIQRVQCDAGSCRLISNGRGSNQKQKNVIH